MTTTNYSLTSKSICEIIKECGESKVKKFRGLDIEIDFFHEEERILAELDAQKVAIKQNYSNPYDEQDEADLKERELEELKFTDPLEYERLIMSDDADMTDQGEEDA